MAELAIYVAAPWKEREAAKVVAQSFRDAGFRVTSRWIDLHVTGNDTDKDPAMLEQEASNDLEDILQANGMVILQYGKSEGKAFEQGFVVAASQFTGMANKLILVSPDGTRGNVFQYLSSIYTVVPTVEAAIAEAQGWPGYVPLAQIVPEDVMKDTTDAK